MNLLKPIHNLINKFEHEDASGRISLIMVGLFASLFIFQLIPPLPTHPVRDMSIMVGCIIFSALLYYLHYVGKKVFVRYINSFFPILLLSYYYYLNMEAGFFDDVWFITTGMLTWMWVAGFLISPQTVFIVWVFYGMVISWSHFQFIGFEVKTPDVLLRNLGIWLIIAYGMMRDISDRIKTHRLVETEKQAQLTGLYQHLFGMTLEKYITLKQEYQQYQHQQQEVKQENLISEEQLEFLITDNLMFDGVLIRGTGLTDDVHLRRDGLIAFMLVVQSKKKPNDTTKIPMRITEETAQTVYLVGGKRVGISGSVESEWVPGKRGKPGRWQAYVMVETIIELSS